MALETRVGLLGGSFDPIHWAHLAVGWNAQRQFRLDRVIIIPCGDPPHKQSGALSPAEHRLAMVELAIAGHPHFEVSRVEIDRTGPSYALDTVRHFQAQGHVGQLYFILGADSLAQITTWHRYQELLASCDFIVAPRANWAAAAVPPQASTARVHWLEMQPMDISATEIRRRVASGERISDLVPAAVEAYIAEHGLYRKT